MSQQTILHLPQGEIKFAGQHRCWDDYGRRAFEIILRNGNTLYGEWKPNFTENETSFDVEIMSFGYASPTNLANPYPSAKAYFSDEEVSTIELLVESLFSNREARAAISPFNLGEKVFTGSVLFNSGWIQT